MHTIKGRNGMGLTEAEDIKKRWQEYTGELYKKDPNNPDNHHGVITHLEPDILEFEVKWVLKGVFIPIPKKGNAKECSNYHTIALISHISNVMLKMLQSRS